MSEWLPFHKNYLINVEGQVYSKKLKKIINPITKIVGNNNYKTYILKWENKQHWMVPKSIISEYHRLKKEPELPLICLMCDKEVNYKDLDHHLCLMQMRNRFYKAVKKRKRKD